MKEEKQKQKQKLKASGPQSIFKERASKGQATPSLSYCLIQPSRGSPALITSMRS